MTRKILFLLAFLTLLLISARPQNFTFSDVVIDGQVIEIEATSKTNHTHCSYFEDDYADFIGWYADAAGFTDPADVLAFCVDGFPGTP